MSKATGTDKTKIAVMANNIEHIKTDIADIKHKLEQDYVTKTEFEPVKRMAYGLVGLVLVGVVTALLSLVLR